jgi:succinyl-diaminopimelate desuccinylase
MKSATITSLVERILSEIDMRKSELIKFTSEIVQHDTSNPPGLTEELILFLREYLLKQGFTSEVVEAKPGFQNLVCPVGNHVSAGKNEGLILCGHLDVVPPGDQTKWSTPPFSGRISQGKVWGRGSADMKGGVAGLVIAFLTVAKNFEKLIQRRITLALVADEETGGELGSGHLTKGGEILQGNEVIIGEPTRFRSTGHVIVAGERGNLRARVTFSGKPAHASVPMLGVNAVAKAIKNLAPSVGRQVFTKVNPPHDARTLISEGRKVLKREGPRLKGRTRDRVENTMNHYTLNLGVMTGGTKINVVPASCEVQFDLRLPLGGKREIAEKLIQEVVGKEAQIEVFGYSPPSYTTRKSYLVRNLKDVAMRVMRNDIPVICSPYTTDAHYFRSASNIDAVAFGPGYLDTIHGFDECVDVNDILNCCKVYAVYSCLSCLKPSGKEVATSS